MKTDGNDNAFAVADEHSYLSGGLTKREYFAAMCLQGMLSNPSYAEAIALLQTQKGINPNNYLSRSSVETADALIEALNQAAKQ